MQVDTGDLQQVRIGFLPIIRKYMKAFGIKEMLTEALHQSDYAEALETLIMSALLRPDALYRVGEWANAFDDGLVRRGKIDHFEAAEGLFQMREGYRIYWYRSSEKKVRDQRIAVARGQLLNRNNVKRRGPKSEAAMKKASDKIIARYKIGDWLMP